MLSHSESGSQPATGILRGKGLQQCPCACSSASQPHMSIWLMTVCWCVQCSVMSFHSAHFTCFGVHRCAHKTCEVWYSRVERGGMERPRMMQSGASLGCLEDAMLACLYIPSHDHSGIHHVLRFALSQSLCVQARPLNLANMHCWIHQVARRFRDRLFDIQVSSGQASLQGTIRTDWQYATCQCTSAHNSWDST